MAGRKRGLGRSLADMNAANAATPASMARDASSRANDPFGLRSLIPNEEQLAAREADPTGYEMAIQAFRNRIDGLDNLTPNQAALQRRLSRFGTDTDFGSGYEVVNPAKTNNPLGRARAQKIGYNRSLQYLAILMRDGTMIGYPDVTPDEWSEYQNFVSTSEYIDTVLVRYNGGNWDNLGKKGTPPQTNEQNFEQGTQD